MQRHSFDPISFFFGAVFVAMATWVLFVDDLDVFQARWLWPLVLILGGLALLASMFTGRMKPEPAAPARFADDELSEAAAELPDEPHLT